MLSIQGFNHVGIRIKDKSISVPFYKKLGFKLISETGFEQGHPIVMKHSSDVVINLLGPSNAGSGENILMDMADKHPGLTHVAFTIKSIDETKAYLKENNIELTGSFSFGGMSAVFVRDPDRNVIELDAYTDDDIDMSRFANLKMYRLKQ